MVVFPKKNVVFFINFFFFASFLEKSEYVLLVLLIINGNVIRLELCALHFVFLSFFSLLH